MVHNRKVMLTFVVGGNANLSYPLLSLSLSLFHDALVSQTIYYKTAGKPLHVELRTKALLISILLPLLSAGSVVLTHYVIRTESMKVGEMFVLQVVPYCYLDTLTYMLGAYWYLACEVLSHTARVLADDFQKVCCFHDIHIN